MSVPIEQKNVLTECNGAKNCKRKRLLSDEEELEAPEKGGIGGGAPCHINKKWKFEFSPKSLEEMGVGMIEWEEGNQEEQQQRVRYKRLSDKENVDDVNKVSENVKEEAIQSVEQLKTDGLEGTSSQEDTGVECEKSENDNSSEEEQNEEEEAEEEFTLNKPKTENDVQGVDYFGKLSDEVILHVFSYLPRKQLCFCAQVCKRFQLIAYDEQFWTYLDLSCRILPEAAIQQVLNRNVVILRLAQTVFMEPLSHAITYAKNFVSKLHYLDLSMSKISPAGLSTLLRYSRHLRKLSLENCELTPRCLTLISRCTQLEVLNLTLASGIDADGICKILTSCKKLLSLNLGWTKLDTEALNMLACKVPSRLERLNVSGCRKTLTDEHVIEIFHRCENLLELDVSDCIELSDNVIKFICNHVSTLEHLSVSRCYNISHTALFDLNKVRSLLYLDVFGTFNESEVTKLNEQLPGLVGVNLYLYSSIARPTVGIRRTSIWGLRVRD